MVDSKMARKFEWMGARDAGNSKKCSGSRFAAVLLVPRWRGLDDLAYRYWAPQ